MTLQCPQSVCTIGSFTPYPNCSIFSSFKFQHKRVENVLRLPVMVSQMLQNSTTCTFVFNSLYLCSATYIYIQRFIFIFNNTHFPSTSTKILFIQQKYLFNFIQQQYLFNFNDNYFYSTKIIIQLLSCIVI